MKVPSYLVSSPIPWDREHNFETNSFDEILNQLMGQSCDGLYLFGTSGEGYAVSENEFSEIVAQFAETTSSWSGYRQVGCFGLSTSQIKWKCKVCEELNIKQIQITLPFWKELTDDELDIFFSELCGEFQDLEFLLYNNPRNKRRLKGEELECLHRKNNNLIAAKTGSGNWMEIYELLNNSPSINHFLTEASFSYGYQINRSGFIPSYHYVFPDRCRSFYEAVVSNNIELAEKMHHEIMNFFFKTAKPLLDKGYIDGAIDKAYAKIGGMNTTLTIKSPYKTLSKNDFEWLEKETISFKQQFTCN